MSQASYTLDIGQPCIAHEDCQSNYCHLKCLESAPHSPCNPSLDGCPSGYTCHSETRTCVRPHAHLNLVTCNRWWQCSWGDYCYHGRCLPRRTLGQTCTKNSECISGTECHPLIHKCMLRCNADDNCAEADSECINFFCISPTDATSLEAVTLGYADKMPSQYILLILMGVVTLAMGLVILLANRKIKPRRKGPILPNSHQEKSMISLQHPEPTRSITEKNVDRLNN